MPKQEFTQQLQLPELKFLSKRNLSKDKILFTLQKESDFEVCPKCATKSSSTYDHKTVRVKDSPLRDQAVFLDIIKRRFYCRNCKSVFTEPIGGIKKGHRTTERFRRHIMWCADNFKSLTDVRKQTGASTWLIHKAYYEQLELQLRKIQNPWASTIGIDEHAIRRSKDKRYREFGTIFVEYSHRRIREIALGRTPGELLTEERLTSIPGRENVKNVIIDMSKAYRNFVKEFFPNAKIIADRFHVVRLINVIINKYRKQITGDVRKNPIRKLLLKKSKDLEPWVKRSIREWLKYHPEMAEIYSFKERLHGFYNIKGTKHARRVLIKMLDDMALSKIPEIRSMRRTLKSWFEEILGYFENKLNNGRTEGFNRKAKLIQRNAYGFKNFENYRKRLIYECS